MQSGDNYNRGGFYAFIFAMGFSLAFFAYVSFIHPGVKFNEVREVPAADGSQPAQAQAGSFDPKSVAKPWEYSEEMATHGKKVFAQTCSSCHGTGGQGDGPVAASMNPKPRNLVAGGWKQGGDTISLYKTLKSGIPGTSMAPFGGLPKEDRWAMVHFIRSITQDKPADDAAKLEQFAATAD